MYKYRVKGKEMTFDTSKLNEKDKLRWEKLGKIGKLRMIESYNLNDKSGIPGDYIDVKTVKDKPQNERLAKLRIEEQKKTELDKIKENNDLKSSDSLDDVEDAMSDEQKTLFKDDLSKLKKDNQNPTISDLEKVYASKIEQLTANEIGTINAKNVDTINASSVNKLLLDVNKLTNELVNPLRPILENLIERHGDDRRVLELADRNDIQGLMNELRRLKDDTTINEIKNNIDLLKSQVDRLTGLSIDIESLQNIADMNSNQLNEVLNKIKNEPNPITRMDEIKTLISNKINRNESVKTGLNELKEMIEKILNENLTIPQVQEIINDKSLFEDLKNELKTEFGDKAQTVIDKINSSDAFEKDDSLESEDIKQVLTEIKNILMSSKEHKDITIDDIKTALKEDKEALSKEIDEILKTKFNEYKEAVMGKTKLTENKDDILKGIFNELINKYPDEFVNIAKGELSDEKHKEIILNTFSSMRKTLIDAINDLITRNDKCVIGRSNSETRTGNTYYSPYITFENDNWQNMLINAIKSGENLRILPSNAEKSSSQLSNAYIGYDKMIELMEDFVNQNQMVRTSGSLISKIKGKLTSDDVKKDINSLKDEVKSLKDEINELKHKLSDVDIIKPKQESKIGDSESKSANDFLNDIIKHKDLKHINVNEKPIQKDYDEGIISNLKDIMKKRREDIEPDEYSEEDEIDWAAGLRRPRRKILSYNEFKELI